MRAFPRADVARSDFDGVLILGAGLAGLSAALSAAGAAPARGAARRRVLLVSPTPLGEGSASVWAQGGIAAALASDDDPALHAADTVAAGAGLVDPDRALALARAGPAAVRALAALGAPFDRDATGGFVQSLEAAHSRPRVARVGGDNAGRAIMRAMVDAVTACAAITVWTDARARRLLQDADGRILGALVTRGEATIAVRAAATILATGGLGGLYDVTTDPAEIRGEGLGIAALAGARIADAEFVQFHPTALDLGLDPAPLASEALRGEGAILVDRRGRRFMADYDTRGELAPRDVVARAIHAQIAAGCGAYLDARAAIGDAFDAEFPNVFAACMRAGVDPRREPMPVAPAAHYHMGGVAADLDGRTSLEGLFAVGECASTGVHGANRLASNSLLEATVCGARAGEIAAAAEMIAGAAAPPTVVHPDLPPVEMRRLRLAMSRDAGVERDAAGLTRLVGELADRRARRGDAPALVAATLIAEAALERRETRGAHYRRDFPPASAAPAFAAPTSAALVPQSRANARPAVGIAG